MTRSSNKKTDNQPPLFESFDADHMTGNQVINVSSVPQRSVFRYPGGKTWFVPYFRQWIGSLSEAPLEFIEPFAGGGIIGLTAAFEGLAEKVTLVERDPEIASVWQTILSEDAAWLAEKVIDFELTETAVEAVLSRPFSSTRDTAFQTILKNRVNRGGILAAGAGRLKTGENGKGMASRWYPETLGRRIVNINALRDRITFVEGDGVAFIQRCAPKTKTVYFIDPPYTAGGKRAGSRLYTYSELDHVALFEIADHLAGDFLMTYDDAEDVRALAQTHGFSMKNIAMKNTHHAQLTELVISRDLGWL